MLTAVFLVTFFEMFGIVSSARIVQAQYNGIIQNQQTFNKFTVDELLTTVFPTKTSNDTGLNPCKAEVFVDDIAISLTEYQEVKERAKRIHLQKKVLPWLDNEDQNPDYLRNNGIIMEKDDSNQKYDQKFQKPRRKRAVATVLEERLWTNGVIPYEFDEHFSGMRKTLVKHAMRHWENFTCLTFVERNKSEHNDFILFTEKPCGCCSFVGKRDIGAQALSIGENCAKFGIVLHEIGHAIGYYHEHTRPDRDNYIQVFTENIISGQEFNFNKLTDDQVTSFGLKYDYNSIMHYAKNTYSKNTYLDTIQPVEGIGEKVPEIGQRIRLSAGDIAQTNILYNCPKCGRTFQGPSGTFSSPLSNIAVTEEGLKCEWRIAGTHGEKIILNITGMDIKKSMSCNSDYLEVRDGYRSDSTLLGIFCGRGEFRNIMSSSSKMLVTYFAKNPKEYRGFSASYEAICGGDVTVTNEGNLESPNYPEEYHPNKECVWRITVPETYQVAIRFQSFDLEHQENCSYDFLEVRDGVNSKSPLLKLLCGQSLPDDIVSTSNTLWVRFVTDKTVHKGGFSAKILAEYDECSKGKHGCSQVCVNTLGSFFCSCDVGYELHSDKKSCVDACGGIFEGPNGTITSPSFPEFYPPNKNCVWEIKAPKQYSIFINFTHIDLEGNNYAQQICDYDRVEVYSKLRDNTLVQHGSFCGTKKPQLIASLENVVRITFASDDNIQKTGFAAVYFTDFNQCSVDNGGCEHECINTFGSYSCSCKTGFILQSDGKHCKEGDCVHKIFTPPYGTLSSPKYPNHYPSNKDCAWELSTAPGHRIRLAFLYFKLEEHPECFFDYIWIYDGQSSKSQSLGKFCGSSSPNLVTSMENQLYMIFKSDNNVQRKGFWATYSSVCGGILLATSERKQILSHAGFGNSSYENMARCDWSIQANSGYNIRLTFIHFDLELEDECSYDFLEVFDGADSAAPSFGRFCGNKKPYDITSTQETILLQFRTDDRIVSKGFTFEYQAIEGSLLSKEEYE